MMENENFGVNVILKHHQKNQLDNYLLLLKQLKAGWVRLALDFYAYAKGEFDFQSHDYFIKNLRQNKIKILGSLKGFVPGTLVNLIKPSWSGFSNPLDKFSLYQQFVADFCQRYRQQIFHWQVWNEPNTKRMWVRKPSALEYSLLVKKIQPVIKKINKNNQVVLGPINASPFLSRTTFEEYFLKLLKEEVDQWIDVYAFHPYFVLGNYFSFHRLKDYQIKKLKGAVSAFLQIYRENKLKKPIWITEMGIADRWVRLSSKQIGEVYTEMFKFSLRRGVAKFFIWHLIDFDDPCYSAPNPERFFGLAKTNLEAKESFQVLRDFFKGGLA